MLDSINDEHVEVVEAMYQIKYKLNEKPTLGRGTHNTGPEYFLLFFAVTKKLHDDDFSSVPYFYSVIYTINTKK